VKLEAASDNELVIGCAVCSVLRAPRSTPLSKILEIPRCRRIFSSQLEKFRFRKPWLHFSEVPHSSGRGFPAIFTLTPKTTERDEAGWLTAAHVKSELCLAKLRAGLCIKDFDPVKLLHLSYPCWSAYDFHFMRGN
jgi:hypothetical protein